MYESWAKCSDVGITSTNTEELERGILPQDTDLIKVNQPQLGYSRPQEHSGCMTAYATESNYHYKSAVHIRLTGVSKKLYVPAKNAWSSWSKLSFSYQGFEKRDRDGQDKGKSRSIRSCRYPGRAKNSFAK